MDKRKLKRTAAISAGFLVGAFAALSAVGRAKCKAEDAELNRDNPYLAVGEDGGSAAKQPESGYEKYVKPALDKVLSFGGMVALAPVYAATALAIYIDDPGPVFFAQKRIGKDKRFFLLSKYRSMKMSTPHDVPTHMLDDPEQYITRVGRFIRKYSIDELPQLWNAFNNQISLIGPRPALWNQEDLIAERDKYGANQITPGITGWAQINGRDELEIPEKAKLDGDYVKELKKGGLRAFLFDAKCFLGTLKSVSEAEGVVEGGTGEMHKNDTPITLEQAGCSDYAFRKRFVVDKSANNHKRILVTGANSYIANAFAAYAQEHYSDHFEIEKISLRDDSWKNFDFSVYDCVFHCAGIAHADVGEVDEETRRKYYAVNTELTLAVAEKAKADGAKQFVLMSSMIIYGESAGYGSTKMVGEHTLPAPANVYGDSKWRADYGVRQLADDNFHVAVLRPPMIYGKGSKGNYPTLAKIAKSLPVFPDADNERSMLHIDNLCEFLCQLMLCGEGGVYFPQNREYTKTGEMVRKIAESSDKKIHLTKILNPAVSVASHMPGKIGGLANKAFGNMTYDQVLSRYDGMDYQVNSLTESIQLTEGNSSADEKSQKHILVISQYFYPEQFRVNDIASEWVKRGYQVTVLTGIPNYPMGKYFDGYDLLHKRRETWNGMDIIRIPLIARGHSAVGMMANYGSFVVSGFVWNLVNQIRADAVFMYEVSPMTQALIGVQYKRMHHVPLYLYVQDLWPENVEIVTGIHNKAVLGPIGTMVNYIYKHCDHIFATSPSFVKEIQKRCDDPAKVSYWPQYAENFYVPIPRDQARTMAPEIPDDGSFKIIFTGNIGKAQGLDILPAAARRLKDQELSRDVKFIIVGDGREQDNLIAEIEKNDVRDSFLLTGRKPMEHIPAMLACCDAAFVSFMNNDLFAKTIPAKLQSYMACGLPVLASAVGETERIIREADCGLCSPIGDAKQLAENICAMMQDADLRRKGENARSYFEEHFDRAKLMDELDTYFQGQAECIGDLCP